MPVSFHSRKSPNWGLPDHLLDSVRYVLGGEIDCDPASSPEFNQRVKASRIYTKDDSGLHSDSVWGDRVYLNPPGGLVGEFWDELVRRYQSGEVKVAVWLGFSVEQLALLANPGTIHPLHFTTCVLRRRVRFIDENGNVATNPTHGNYVTLVGGGEKERQAFKERFGELGVIVYRHGDDGSATTNTGP